MNTLHKVLAWSVVGATLMAVFALYTRPSFLVTLANQIWACF